MEDINKLLLRLKNTSDGKDFLDYLLDLSKINYNSWKQEGGDVLRGKAIAIDQLLSSFENCDKTTTDNKDSSWAF